MLTLVDAYAPNLDDPIFLSKYRLQVVSSFPPRRSSRIKRREMRKRAKSEARTKKRAGERSRREREGKMETTDSPLLQNLRGRWRPQYSDWPVLAFPSTGLTT